MIPALEIDNLDISLLSAGNPPAPIVKSLSLRLDPGEIAGLAGESGSGKSLTALATMRLLSPRSFRVEARSMRLAGVERRLDLRRADHASSMVPTKLSARFDLERLRVYMLLHRRGCPG